MATERSPFEITSDVEMTRGDRWRAFVEETVLAPLAILWEDRRARFGLAVTLLFVLAGTVGVELVDVPRASDGPRLLKPFAPDVTGPLVGLAPVTIDVAGVTWTYTGIWRFPLGTDQVGKGILASLVHSTPPILKMMLAGAVFSNAVAVAWGTFAGYKGGFVDRALMSVSDVVMTIPGLPLIVVLSAIWTPENPYVVGLLLSVNTWAGFSRSLRSQVLTIRQEEYVEASRTIGLRNHRIITRDVMPNLMPLIMVHFVTSARGIIFKSVGLYFLGILPFTSVNWGVMMSLAYKSGAMFDMSLAHWFLAPMVTIVLLSLGLILLGQGMDRIFNPRIRAKHVAEGDAGDTEGDDSTDLRAIDGGDVS